MILHFTTKEREHFPDDFIDIVRSFSLAILFEYRPDATNHLASATTIVDDVLKSGAGLGEVRSPPRQSAQTRIAVCGDCCQRLIDLMSD